MKICGGGADALTSSGKLLYDAAAHLLTMNDGVGVSGFALSAGGVVPGYGAIFCTNAAPSTTKPSFE